jgi:hypothetical protein
MLYQCTGLEKRSWDRPGDFFYFSEIFYFYLHIPNRGTRISGSAVLLLQRYQVPQGRLPGRLPQLNKGKAIGRP